MVACRDPILAQKWVDGSVLRHQEELTMRCAAARLAIAAAFALSSYAALPTRAATPNDQLVVAISMAQFISLDPGQATEGPVMEVISSIYDRLVAMDPANPNKVVPQLAERWDVADGKITF